MRDPFAFSVIPRFHEARAMASRGISRGSAFYARALMHRLIDSPVVIELATDDERVETRGLTL